MTPRRFHRPARRVALTLGALAVVLAVTGCDLRLEGAAPSAPSPGPVEQVRERTVGDALALSAEAGAARSGADGAAAAVLDDVVAFSTAQADQLGGTYRSGLPEPTATTTPVTVTATPQDVLGALRSDAATAFADAAVAPDGGLARLVASVGVARDALASRLAVALGQPAGTGSPAPVASGTPVATPPTTPATPVPQGSAAASDLPSGLTASDVAPLVLALDQAGFGLEVVAAKLTGDGRTSAETSAAEHRAAAESWALRAGIAGTGADPRRAAYAVPAGADDPAGARALAANLDSGVADAASTAIVHAAAGARGELIDELRTAAADAVAWGAAPQAFPGVPNLG